MSLADEFLQLEADLAGLFGQAATLTVRTSTSYSASGVVTETTTDTAVTAIGPVRLSDRYSGADQSVSCAWFLPAKNLTLTPKKGDRITAGGTVWQIVSVDTSVVNSTTVGYKLDCGEVAS